MENLQDIIVVNEANDTIIEIKDKTIESITIPDGITTISPTAFSGCLELKTLVIPNSMTSIGYWTFSGCINLTRITIPNSVTSIGDRAFGACGQIQTIDYLGDIASWCEIKGLGNLMYYAFEKELYISGQKIEGDLTIPKNVTSIGDYAFYGCIGLTSITIPNSVTSIGSSAFGDSGELTSITVADGNTIYHSKDNCLIETASKTLIVGCKTSIIPTDGSVTGIGEDAFCECSGLTSITIPDSVTDIGEDAFYECSNLTSVTIGNRVKSIGSDAFCECSGLTSITIPDSVTDIGNYAFHECSSLTSITIGNGVKNIGSDAFWECSGLTSITIPDSVTSIGYMAFYNTAWYNNQPDGLMYAGKVAYVYKGTMPDNTTITLKEGTKSITSFAFSGCSGLISITIPDSVTSIGDWAFWSCSGLTSINYSGTKEEWKAIGKSSYWNENTGGFVVVCTDGTLAKDEA